MTDATSRGELLGKGRRRRWNFVFWIVEVMAIAAILVVVLLLQYSEEGYMRRNGIRVTATVDELPSGTDNCERCPLLYTIDGERHRVEESLVAGQGEDGQRRYFPGEAIELYVDPNDMTHTIEVQAIEENIDIGVIGIAVVAVFAVAWPVYEFKRSIPPSIGAPN